MLDANCVRGSPIAELQKVREAGFTLHASIEGVREVWAKSVRENQFDTLAGRFRALAPHLSSDEPIAFVGKALLSQIGTLNARDTEQSRRFRDDVLWGWRRIAEGALEPANWRAIGEELKEELDADEAAWLKDIEEAVKLERLGKSLADDRTTIGRSLGALMSGLADGAMVPMRPPLRERANLHLRYMGGKLLTASSKRPSSNDFHDARHLQHVAWPAFLMTVDFKLIEACISTGSIQRTWVRSPVELAEDEAPSCNPWGKKARRANMQKRAEIEAIKARQKAFRELLRGT